jgi:hypothetical protein
VPLILGRTLPTRLLAVLAPACDGEPDCADASDEAGCR